MKLKHESLVYAVPIISQEKDYLARHQDRPIETIVLLIGAQPTFEF